MSNRTPLVPSSTLTAGLDVGPSSALNAAGGASPDLLGGALFVGREHEREAFVAMLDVASAGVPRLVTITGAAGMGKTRLARRVAADVAARFEGGAWFVELAPVAVPTSVPDVVVMAIGGRRSGEHSALTALAERTSSARMLVVLDNCEHVRAAAAQVAHVIGAGGSVVLATSREPLRAPGEQTVPLAPLTDAAAVELFSGLARSADPSFVLDEGNATVVLQLCRQLDGMPLAIELAAARVRSMTVTEILDRLSRRFRLLRGGRTYLEARHRTLQAAVQWSFDLLDGAERALFSQLSAFAGGFTLDAAVKVAAPESADELDVIDLLDGLVSRSMVVADVGRVSTRYGMLETLRQFGAELLTNDEITAVRRRHADYYVRLAEHASELTRSPDAAAACRTFNDEWDNLRASFEWLAGTGEVDGALRLVLACHSYAGHSLRFELLDWAEHAITLDGALDHPLWSAVAGVTATLRYGAGDLSGAEEIAAAALDHERARGLSARFEPTAALWATYWLMGNAERAAEILPRLEQIAETGGDPVEQAIARYRRIITTLLTEADRVRTAGPLAEAALRDALRTRIPQQLALAYLGLLAVDVNGDGARAPELFNRVRRWSAEAHDYASVNNAALWIAQHPPRNDPIASLSAARATLVRARDDRWWGTLHMSIHAIVPWLVRFDRLRSAAVLLGGLTVLESSALDPRPLLNDAEESLAAALGAELDHFVAEGQELTTPEIVALAITETDALLDSLTEADAERLAASTEPNSATP